MLCSRTAKSCNRHALYLYSGMDILSSYFLGLVQVAPALLVFCAFVATSTALSGVDPIKPDVPLKSHCRTSTVVPIQEIDRLTRASPQQINLAARPEFILLAKFAELKTENTGIGGMDLQDV